MNTENYSKFLVAKKDLSEFMGLVTIISNCVDLQKPILFPIWHRFLELMINQEEQDMYNLRLEAQSLALDVEEILRPYKGYELDWQSGNPAEEKSEMASYTRYMFTEIILVYLMYRQDFKAADKEKAIAFFYHLLGDEYKSKLTKESRDNFTVYKQHVIAGALAMSVKFQVKDKSKNDAASIFHGTRQPQSLF